MSKMFGAISTLVVYVLIGQALATLMILGVVAAKGGFTHEKLRQIMAVVQGVDLLALREKVEDDRAKEKEPQISLADVADARARKARDLELREQELRNQVARLTKMQADLTATTDLYRQMRLDFEDRLQTLRDGAIADNMENARLLLENMKAKQAKEQIQKMISENEMKTAVALFVAMPIEKRAKIAAEFKTDEESQQLAEMLRLIRAGEPVVTMLDDAEGKLDRLNR